MCPIVSRLIDVWDVKTFDEKLAGVLASAADLIRNYLTTDHKIFLSHDLGCGPSGSILRPENPYASAFLRLEETIGAQMEFRTIRGWHYTRLTEPEAAALQRAGIQLSTPATLRARLDALVTFGVLSPQLANALYAASPFHSDQLEARTNKFWMVSHPLVIDDGGVKPLMAHWGGEVASMWIKDPAFIAPLAAMGRRRVLEIAVPLASTRHSYSAGKAVIATFGRTLGCIPGKYAFDFYVTTPLHPDAILSVHSEGDASFDIVGQGYPEGYLDVNIGRWKELTGDEDD